MAFNKSKQFDQRYYNEYNYRLEAADKLASYFKTDILITPELQPFDWRINYFFKDAPFKNKFPDLKIGNEFWEVKSYEDIFTVKKVTNMLHSGTGQSRN